MFRQIDGYQEYNITLCGITTIFWCHEIPCFLFSECSGKYIDTQFLTIFVTRKHHFQFRRDSVLEILVIGSQSILSLEFGSFLKCHHVSSDFVLIQFYGISDFTFLTMSSLQIQSVFDLFPERSQNNLSP